jgi:predicted RNase H-like HicB family nuclease
MADIIMYNEENHNLGRMGMNRRRSMKDFHINIFYSQEDEGYIADIPDLKGRSAFGNTPEEALKEVQLARVAWIETALAQGITVPEPRYQPVIYQAAS